MLKVLKNTLRAPEALTGPASPARQRSLACLACDDAHTCLRLSLLCIPAYISEYLRPVMTRAGPSLRHRYFSISVSSTLLTNTSKRSLSCCCIFS